MLPFFPLFHFSLSLSVYLSFCFSLCLCYFLMGQPRPLFVYFRSFPENNTIFTTNQCEKMSIQYQCTAPGFEPMTFWTWVVTHNHLTRAPCLCISFSLSSHFFLSMPFPFSVPSFSLGAFFHSIFVLASLLPFYLFLFFPITVLFPSLNLFCF